MSIWIDHEYATNRFNLPNCRGRAMSLPIYYSMGQLSVILEFEIDLRVEGIKSTLVRE
jgi:hypothetical protein